MFRDRTQAGEALARQLAPHLHGEPPLVLAIPRGGLAVGEPIARELGGELEVALVAKLRAPFQPELALGAVDEQGHVVLSPGLADLASEAWLEAERTRALELLHRRSAMYRAVAPRIAIEGRTAVMVDDGLATGASMRAALELARRQHPARLLAAAPVASADAAARVRQVCDLAVFLEVRDDLGGISEFYRDFAQLEDADAVALLRRARSGAAAG